MKLTTLLFTVITLLWCAQASAQTPGCDALSGDAKAVAQSVLTTAYPYACCDETIAACLKSAPSCKLPKLLANETCRLAAAGKSAQDIKHILDQRAMSMGSLTPPVKIEKRTEHLWGTPNAKVVLSIYLCGRCPYCSRHVPALIEALEKSPLKEKVAINLRLFPIKSHDNSTPAALGIEAAAQMGQAWPFILKVYKNFDQYSNDNLVIWAKELGLDEAKFSTLSQDAATRNLVVSSKKEGLTNHVESTPTFFLNGHKIQGTFDVESILSMLEEAVN
ncbi:MAG: thioredoxin domain-containing protein [Proteobacteria bacterium]|nr:thioredoxin domain-containing protein [Pseudomonadota bacterium]